MARRRFRRRLLALLGNDDGTRAPLQTQRSSGGDSLHGRGSTRPTSPASQWRLPCCGQTPRLRIRPRERASTIPPAAFAYRYKYGFGLNWEQEITKNVGVFSRLGCNDGHEVAWTYTDANWSASLGVAIKGAAWHRPDDTVGLAGILSGASREQIEFLKAGGTGILNGDGNLTYASEKVLETYYDFPIGKAAHFALDYQFVGDPAFNSDRGPVSIFAVRLHWEQ